MKRLSVSDQIVNVLNIIGCVLVAVITLYPLVYIFSMSISRPEAVISNQVTLWPVGFSLQAYGIVFKDSGLWLAYWNTLIYTVCGTALSVVLTLMAAYPLSRKRFFLRKQLSVFFSATMFFSGTLVPMFILINSLHLYNTRWAIILPAGAAAWYIIMARTFLAEIPESLYESARIDGAGEWRILRCIFIPLAKPIIIVLILYYAITQWNSYFNALIFLPNQKLQPLQLYLMKVLIQNGGVSTSGIGKREMSLISLQLEYVVIVVAVVPILMVYPFLQRYLVKGMLVGAVKE